MIYKILPLLVFVLFSFQTNTSKTSETLKSPFEDVFVENTPLTKYETIYHNLQTNNFKLPKQKCFTKALEGYYQWSEMGKVKKDILTIVDFSMSSKEERLWVIDLKNNEILFQTLVAHGRNSGVEYATNFSNRPESHQSSLGFYTTGETYLGKHGYSLRLDGLEKGLNNNARKRAIVMHGADYVSESFIENNGRLGRSFGCPSIPKELNDAVINAIKEKSCLYIYFPSISKSILT